MIPAIYVLTLSSLIVALWHIDTLYIHQQEVTR